MAEPTQPQRVLVITAHPDDVDFGAAGTIATWTDAGIDVSYCVITDGDAGGFDHDVSRTEMPRIRRDEQRAAAKVVGVDDVVFLGYRDGELEVTLDLRHDLTREIRRARPDRVLLQSPERDWERIHPSHPDHLAGGEAAMCAVYPDSRNPFAFPDLLAEGFAPHVVPEVWVMGGPRRHHYVDVTATLDRKLAAIASHASQLPDGDRLADDVAAWLAANAAEAGLPQGHHAEVFQVVQTG